MTDKIIYCDQDVYRYMDIFHSKYPNQATDEHFMVGQLKHIFDDGDLIELLRSHKRWMDDLLNVPNNGGSNE